MVVLSIEDYFKGKGRKRVVFDNRDAVVLYRAELARLDLDVDAEVSDRDYELIYSEILPKRAKKRAMHLLEKMDRTESNVRLKLREADYPDSVIDEAIDYLYKYHYLDDERFGENYVRYHSNGKSRKLLRQDLLRKGVRAELADEILDSDYDTDERALIRRELNKKGYNALGADDKTRQRMYGYLLRRGFEMSDICAEMRLN